MPPSALLTIIALVVAVLCIEVARGAPNLSAWLWRPAIRRFRRADATSEWPEDAVLLYGSSTIRFWKSAEEDLAPWPIVRRGFGGARTSDVLRYAHDVLGDQRPSAVVIYIANDISGSVWDVTPTHAAMMFRQTLEIVRLRVPTAPVLWIRINPTPRRWTVWPQIKELNDAFAAVCRQLDNVHVVDASAGLSTDGVPDPQFFRADRLHLNDAGYELFSVAVREALNRFVGPPLERSATASVMSHR